MGDDRIKMICFLQKIIGFYRDSFVICMIYGYATGKMKEVKLWN